MAYTPTYTKPYPDGWQNLPSETTPITAEVLGAYDKVIAAMEEQLQETTEIYENDSVSLGRKSGTEKPTGSAVFGTQNTATAYDSHATGRNNISSGECSSTEGMQNTASGHSSHAEGMQNTAAAPYSHAEGYGSKVEEAAANGHAEGINTTVSAVGGHAEGQGNSVSGVFAHAEGYQCRASGAGSHVQGQGTVAAGDFQNVQGKFNVEDTAGTYAHIVGGGTSDAKRKNIHTVDWKGNAFFAGDVTDGEGNSLSGLKQEIPEMEALDIDFSNYFS